MSIGDVIVFSCEYYLIMPTGFSKMNTEELELYKLVAFIKRQDYCYRRHNRHNKLADQGSMR